MNRIGLVLALAIALGAGAARGSQGETSVRSEAATPDREAMRRDIAQMRVLVDQMQRNLAQVSSGQTALKHQFELDIQMWQLVLSRMEREAGSATDTK